MQIIEYIQGPWRAVALLIIFLVPFFDAYIGPSMVFGFGYDLFFKSILDIEIGSKFESFYLSLMLTNTLPVSDTGYSNLISLVNKNTTLSYFHTFQLFFTKLVDGILLVAIFNLLGGVLKIARV